MATTVVVLTPAVAAGAVVKAVTPTLAAVASAVATEMALTLPAAAGAIVAVVAPTLVDVTNMVAMAMKPTLERWHPKNIFLEGFECAALQTRK